jgi:hypothetical protein
MPNILIVKNRVRLLERVAPNKGDLCWTDQYIQNGDLVNSHQVIAGEKLKLRGEVVDVVQISLATPGKRPFPSVRFALCVDVNENTVM